MNPDVRRRILTERGAEYTTDIRRRNLKRCITKWRRLVGETWDMMTDVEDAETLKDNRGEIKLVFADVEEASRKFLEVSAIDEMPIDSLERETADLRKVLSERIMELKDQDTGSKRSQRTRATSHRSIRSVKSLKLEEEAKAAELEVKLKYHKIEAATEAAVAEAEAKLKVETAKMKIEADKRKIEKELVIIKARLQVFREEYSGDSGLEGLSDEEPSDTKVRRYIASLPALTHSATTTTTTSAVTMGIATTPGPATPITHPVWLTNVPNIVPSLGVVKQKVATPVVTLTQPLNPLPTPFAMTTTGDVYGGHPIINQHPVMFTGFKPQIRNTVESSTRAIPEDPLYSSYRNNPIIPEIGQQNRVVNALPDTGKKTSQHVLESMTKLMKKPPTDIEKFDGYALLYRRFVRQFNNYIGAFCENDYERLT